MRPTGGMLAAFSQIAKQRGSHPYSARPTEIDPHLAERILADRSAQDAQKCFTVYGFGDELFGGFSAEFSECR
jgi:hypothetical protein